MRAPLDPFSKVTNEDSRWDPEWYSWLQDLSTTTTQLQANVVTLQASLAAQQAINTAQQAAITALQNPPPGVPVLAVIRSLPFTHAHSEAR